MNESNPPETPEHWEVFIEWSGKKALSPLSVKALRARQSRFRERSADWLDVTPDGCIDLDGVALLLALLVVIALLIVFGPILLVVLFAVVEVTIVLGVAAGAILARTLLNRPWRVVAINGSGDLWSWKQVGWQRAKELVTRIDRELAAGARPEAIGPGDAQPQGRDVLPADTDTHLVESAGVRIAAKVASFALIAWAVIVLVQRFV